LENLQFKGLGVGGYSIPANTQLATLPWTNIDQVRIRFDQDVVVQESQLSLRGVNVSAPSLAVDGFSYDPATFTATWTLAAPLPADKVQLALSDQVFGQFGEPLDGEWSNGADSFPSGNGVAGGPFIFRLNSLPADGDRSGKVDTKDGIGVRQKLSPVPSAIAYSPFFDFNGDSRIDATDGAAVQANLFKSLPAGEPVLPTLLVPDLSEFIAEDTLLTLPVSNLVDRSVGGIGVVTLSGVAAGPRHGTATVTGAHLLYAPDLNYFGEDSFQYVLTSSTGQTSVGTVFVSVAAVNDPPINVLPYIDNDYRGWSVYNRNAISVSDVDAGEAAIKVKLSIDGFNQGDVPGKLFLYSTEGLVVSGNDTPSLEITGPVSAINAALNYGLDFTQSPRHPTDALLTMISDDLNGLTDTDYREIFIPRPKAVFDDVEVNQNSTGIVIDVLRNDFGNEGAQVVLLSFTQPAVGGTVTLVNNGAGNTDDELKFVPDRGFVGVSSFTYTINDSLPPGHPSKGLDSIGTVWVTVNPIYEPSEGFNIAVPGGSVYLDPTLESASGSDELGLGKVGVTALTPAPVVQEVLVRGHDWTPAFLENLQFKGLGAGGYSIPANAQLATLPWNNIDQIRIRFDQDVVVQENQLSIRGVNVSVPAFAVNGFSYDSTTFTATWTLAAPLPADKVQLALSDQVFGQLVKRSR